MVDAKSKANDRFVAHEVEVDEAVKAAQEKAKAELEKLRQRNQTY